MTETHAARTVAPPAPWPSQELNSCPFPFYEDLRREAPVFHDPVRGDYLVSRFDDVREAQSALALLRREGVDLDAAASLDRAAAAYVGEERALAITRVRGANAVVARLVDRVSRAIGGCEEARPGLLADVADVPLRAAIALRLTAPESRMQHRNTCCFMGGALRPPEFNWNTTDEQAVRSVVETLRRKS